MAPGREPYELRGSRTVLKEPRCEIPQATHLVVVVKGTHAQAEAIREACWTFLEGTLNLTVNLNIPRSLLRGPSLHDLKFEVQSPKFREP